MNKSIVFLVSGCAMLLLAGCPKPGGNTNPNPPGGACGSRGLPVCSAGQYCNYPAGANCGRADAPGTCAPKPEICTADIRPVCGCDGATYSNACVAARAGVSVDHEGECASHMCGGIAGMPCPAGLNCVDDPSDNCDPAHGGRDCSGICK